MLPARLYEELTDREAVRERYVEPYRRDASGRKRARPSSDSLPLVSVVIPYYALDEFVEETVQSVIDQTYPRIEVLLVNDGSLREEDAVLDDLAKLYPIKILTQRELGSRRSPQLRHFTE